MRRSLLLLTSLAWLASAAAAPPPRLELAWEHTKDGTPIAEIVQTLDYSRGKYQITELWHGRGLYRLMGTIKRQSRGEVDAEGLRPAEYTDERSGRATERATFDWKA